MSKSIYSKIFTISQELSNIPQNGYNNFKNFRYSRISDIEEVLKPLLIREGLVIVNQVRVSEFAGSTAIGYRATGNQILTTRLIDVETGEEISSEICVGSFDESPQNVGGRITYARRYNLSCLFSLLSEEDADQSYGSESGKSTKRSQSSQKKPTPAPTRAPAPARAGKTRPAQPPVQEVANISNLIKESDALIKHLSWDVEKARGFLKRHFGKVGRSQLTGNEWTKFLDLLRAEATPPDSDFIDSVAYGIEE